MSVLSFPSAGNGPVTVWAEIRPDRLLIAITDSGPGIPAQDLPRIFERYYRGPDGRARANGAGPGLSISREIVRAHGGELSVQSEPGRKTLVVLGGPGMATALVLFAGSSGYPGFAVAAMPLGAGSGLAGPAPSAYLTDVVPATERTIAVGLYRTPGDLGAALAPPLLGGLADLGGYALPLFAAAVLLIAASSSFGRLAPTDRTTRDSAEPAPR